MSPFFTSYASSKKLLTVMAWRRAAAAVRVETEAGTGYAHFHGTAVYVA
jgi:hypothetical protein